MSVTPRPGPSTSTGTSSPAADDAAGEMPDDSRRSVDLVKIGEHRYKATNVRGGVLPVGAGDDPDFTPVELLLAGLVGCGAIDLDHVTGKRADFSAFLGRAEGHKVRDEQGSHLVRLSVTFDVEFPEGEAGDQARAVVPRTLEQIESRLCTVGRTVTLGEPVAYRAGTLTPASSPAVPGA